MSEALPPSRLKFADEPARTLLAIDWRDGHVGVYPLSYLRGWCPCALCQGHGARQGFAEHAPGPRLTAMEQVGNYALAVTWSDGHDTGIWPWAYLRELCPCPACGGPRAGTPDPVAALVPGARGGSAKA